MAGRGTDVLAISQRTVVARGAFKTCSPSTEV